MCQLHQRGAAAHQHVVDQRLIGPGVVEGRGHVHVTVCQDEQRPLETGDKRNQTMSVTLWRSHIQRNIQCDVRMWSNLDAKNTRSAFYHWAFKEKETDSMILWFFWHHTRTCSDTEMHLGKLSFTWTDSVWTVSFMTGAFYLNCPAAILSPVKRLFLASRRFSRSFLSNFYTHTHT